MDQAATEGDVLFAFQDFYNALTGSDAREVIRSRPELLSDQGLAILRRTRATATDATVCEALDVACSTLERYKERWESVERELGAFVTTPTIAASLRAVQAASESPDGNSIDVVDTWDAIVEHPEFERSSLRFRLMALNNAVHAHRQRYERLTRGEDLDRAVKLAERSLAKLPAGSFERAVHVDALAVSLLDRYRHSGAPEDLERSIQVSDDFIATPPPDSRDLSDTWSNLGHARIELYERAQKLSDLAAAINAYEHAVDETRAEAPNFSIYTNNLGEAMRQLYLATHSRAHLDRAVLVSEQALKRAGDAPVWSLRAMTNLANVLLDRYEIEEMRNEHDLKRALELLRNALDAAAPGSGERAVIANSLASATYFAMRHSGGETSAVEHEIERMEEIVRTVSPDVPEYLPFLYNVGNLHRETYERTGDLANLDRSIEHWDRACDMLGKTFRTVPVDYKLGQQDRWTGLYRQLVLAYIERAEMDPARRQGDFRRAMVVTEAWKSRLFTEIIGRARSPAPASVEVHAQRERELLATLTALDNAEIDMAGRTSMACRLERLRQREQHRRELQQLWDVMAATGPAGTEYVALHRADGLDWNGLSALARELGSETVLISQLMTDSRVLLFVLRAGWRCPNVVAIDLADQTRAELMSGLFRDVYAEPKSTEAVSEIWLKPLKDLFVYAAPSVRGAARVVFVPGGSGHLIPWAVVAERAGWRSADDSPMPIVTVPSLAALARLRGRRPSRRGRPLIVGDSREDMVYAGDEAREIAQRLRARPLLGTAATIAAVQGRLPNASIVHLATHAYFRSGSPLDAAISLADGELTTRDVMRLQLGADLVVLSACETGRVESLGGDEIAGLAMALLQAGARAVLVSLWPVSGLATATMMGAFYDAWIVRRDKAKALAEAIAALRDSGWASPYYWGSFVLVGDWLGRSTRDTTTNRTIGRHPRQVRHLRARGRVSVVGRRF